MENDKVFLGRIKTVETQYGTMTKISFGPKDLEILQKAATETGWSNWTLKESKSGGHYMEQDNWKPERQEIKPAAANAENKPTDDLPF